MVRIRSASAGDAPTWRHMRHAVWPDGSAAEHGKEIDQFFAGLATEPLSVLVAEDGAGALLGFVELSIRPCAEGCRTNRVAFLEGWFVVPEARRRGGGRALVAAAEQWGRAHGCTEFASDTGPDNQVSAAAHLALGLSDVGTVRCFRKVH